ncbi:MAG: hypothetical protein V1859_11045 [archaeon]
MTGQFSILIAYLLLPMYIYYLFNYLREDSSPASQLKLSLSFSICGMFAAQVFAINFLIFILASIYFYQKDEFSIKEFVKSTAIIFSLIFLLNAFWLQGLFSSNVFSQIDSSDEAFYAPKLSENIPASAKIIGMWGFWREAGYITTYKTLPSLLWYALTFMFVLLMLLGFYKNGFKKESKLFFSFWWLGVIFALGISHPYTAIIFNFLFEKIPFFSGFRDSHKFAALIALSYAYLCPYGLAYLKENTKGLLKKAIPIAFIILVLLYTYPLIGFWNQVKSTDYPQSYIDTNDFFKTQNIIGRIIYLPWETYITYNWSANVSSDGRIANPINKLLDPTIITGPEKYGSATDMQNSISECIEKKSIKCLENRSVQYILADSCLQVTQQYGWIDAIKAHKDGCITIYKLNNATAINQKANVPLRFAAGILLSITAFLIVIIKLINVIISNA